MATPAAVLQVMVEANTSGAMSELRRFNTSLKRTDKTSVSATARTNALGKATGRLGGTMASAAKYAAGAAVAYLSIAQAKAAITTTQDLAKTTAGLNRNLGLTTKTASRWASVAKSRDVDAKALTMSFTTLSRRVVEAGHALREGGGAAESAMLPFQRLGLTQKDVAKGSKDLASFLPQLADAFGEAEGGAKRQASAQQLLGKGYSTILPLFADGAKGLKEQMHWADEYGSVLSGKTLKGQMDLVSAQRESKAAMIGLQVTFAQALTPALTRANEQFQKIAKIMANKDLTNAEKFRKVGDIIEKWADKAFDAFLVVLPKITSMVGEKAPLIARALFEGFKEAPIWGKVTLVGIGIGKLFGRGMISGFLLAFPLLLKEAKEWGQDHQVDFGKLGAEIGEWFVNGMIDVVNTGIRAINDSMDALNVLGKFGVDAPNIGEIGKVSFNEGSVMRVAEEHEQAAKLIEKTWKGTWRNVEQATNKAETGMKQNSQVVDTWSRRFGLDTKHASDSAGDFEQGTSGSFRRAGDAAAKLDKVVSSNVTSLASAVGRGMTNIGSMTNKALKAFGVKQLAFDIGAAVGAGAEGKQRGGILKAAAGAIVPGSGSGDKVPLHLNGRLAAMVEPGELVSVANRKATAALMDHNANVPRFAKGGEVSGMSAMIARANAWDAAHEPYQLGGGHGGWLSNVGVPIDCSGAVSDVLHQAGLLQGAPMVSGALMSWGKAATGNEPLVVYANSGHTVMSLNGKAFGTSGSNEGGGAGWIEGASGQSLAPGAMRTMDVAGGVASAMGTAIQKVFLKGPDGPLRDLGQAALDKVVKGANTYVQSKMPAGSFGGGDAEFGAYKGSLDKLFPRTSLSNPGIALAHSQVEGLASKAGFGSGTRRDPMAQTDIAVRESGLHPGIVASDGGYGLWQHTPVAGGWGTGPAFQALQSLGGIDQMLNPWKNAQMAYQLDKLSVGDPWAASAQKGGVIGMAKGGIASMFSQLGSKKGKVRKKALGNILDKVKAVGLNSKTFERLNKLTNDSAIFQEYANRASSLNTDDALGMVLGWSEADWLGGKDGAPGALQKLFELRNVLVNAEEQTQKRMHQVANMLEAARKRFEKVAKFVRDNDKAIKANEAAQEKVLKDIEDAKKKLEAEKGKKPKNQNKQVIQTQTDRIAALQDKLTGLKGERAQLGAAGVRGTRERDLLKTKVIPGITKQQGVLSDLRGNILGSGGDNFAGLETVQGIGSPLGILQSLPPIDVLGGDIFTVRDRLRVLGLPESVSATSTEDTESTTLRLAEAQDWAKRYAVSQAQYKVFAGMFASGGNIPAGQWGIAGEAGPEVVHGPAQVYSNAESSAMLAPNYTVRVDGAAAMQFLERFVSLEVDKRTRQQASKRPLPGVRG